MRTFPAVLYLLLPLTCIAAEWSPYVGAGGQAGTTLHEIGSDYVDTRLQPPLSGFGTQWEAGLTTSRHSFYIAYNLFTPHDHRQWGEDFLGQGEYGIYDSAFVCRTYEETRWWKDRRWSIGWRMMFGEKDEQRVRPVIGVALTSGKSYAYGVRQGQTILMYNSNSRPTAAIPYSAAHSNYSTGSLGCKAEFGLAVQTLPGLDLMFLAQIQAESTTFLPYTEEETTVPMPMGDELAIVPTIHLGARYTFSCLSVGKTKERGAAK